jgi:hypothetical protein
MADVFGADVYTMPSPGGAAVGAAYRALHADKCDGAGSFVPFGDVRPVLLCSAADQRCLGSAYGTSAPPSLPRGTPRRPGCPAGIHLCRVPVPAKPLLRGRVCGAAGGRGGGARWQVLREAEGAGAAPHVMLASEANAEATAIYGEGADRRAPALN